MERTIDDVVESLRNMKRFGRGCTLLIGSGCSVTAGIPTADTIVEEIKNTFEEAYNRASPKTYARCMAELAPAHRRLLIVEYVRKATLNPAHIAIAQLLKHQYVDRILTTNFDTLVLSSCRVLGVNPADHDFASSQIFNPADLENPSVIYLHGKYSGFRLLNIEEEFETHSQLLKPVFNDAGNGRTWIVVGYSGVNDPVFDHLAEVNRFDDNLYWVGYLDEEPPPHVRERLLVKGKYAFYVRGFDADRFFCTLARKLNCFRSGFLNDTRSYLTALQRLVTPYIADVQNDGLISGTDISESISSGIGLSEEVRDVLPSKVVIEVWAHIAAKDFDKVIEMRDVYDRDKLQGLIFPLCIAYMVKAWQCYGESLEKKGGECEDLWNEAVAYFHMAEDIFPGIAQDALASIGALTGA